LWLRIIRDQSTTRAGVDRRNEEEARTVPTVAIVTDSASDLPPEVAARDGITVVPLAVSFGPESFRTNVNLTTDEFWARMTAPDAPFPTTAAAAPGDFKAAYEAAFAAGADAVVCVTVSGDLSGTLKAAQVGAQQLEGRDIRVIDSRTASMGHGMLAQRGARMAREGASADAIQAALEEAKTRVTLYIALDTLEYLKRGGRISGARAAVGTMLSIKPIITVEHGIVENADRVRTRAKARDRVLELLTERPVEEAAILHTTHADVEEFAARFAERSGLPADKLQVMAVGPSVGPHLGPGCVGGVVTTRA
jgi:DegV family protein with EDD domain